MHHLYFRASWSRQWMTQGWPVVTWNIQRLEQQRLFFHFCCNEVKPLSCYNTINVFALSDAVAIKIHRLQQRACVRPCMCVCWKYSAWKWHSLLLDLIVTLCIPVSCGHNLSVWNGMHIIIHIKESITLFIQDILFAWVWWKKYSNSGAHVNTRKTQRQMFI